MKTEFESTWQRHKAKKCLSDCYYCQVPPEYETIFWPSLNPYPNRAFRRQFKVGKKAIKKGADVGGRLKELGRRIADYFSKD